MRGGDADHLDVTDAPDLHTCDPAAGLATLLEQLTDLPTHPGAALGILSVIDDPRSSAGDLARLVDADPALSARVLRLANSAVYGMARQVASAPMAVTIVGFDSVRSLAVLAASGAFSSEGDQAPEEFWGHSVATASGAAVVARQCGVPPSEAFSAGLLHDLGISLLYQVDPRLAAQLDRDLAGIVASRPPRERALYGMTHGEAGAVVLDAWGFPTSMVEVQRQHHDAPSAELPDLVRVVQAGEALASIGGAPGLVELAPDATEALAVVGIDARQGVDDLARQVINEAEALITLLLG